MVYTILDLLNELSTVIGLAQRKRSIVILGVHAQATIDNNVTTTAPEANNLKAFQKHSDPPLRKRNLI